MYIYIYIYLLHRSRAEHTAHVAIISSAAVASFIPAAATVTRAIIVAISIATITVSITIAVLFGRGDDTVGNPHRAQISQFELFELLLSLKLDKQFSIEQFEPTASRSTVSSPPS